MVIELHSILDLTSQLKLELDLLKSKDLKHKLGTLTAQNSWKGKNSRKRENKDLSLTDFDSGRNSDKNSAHFDDVQHLQVYDDLSASKGEAVDATEDVDAQSKGQKYLVERRCITSQKVEQEIYQRFVGITSSPNTNAIEIL